MKLHYHGHQDEASHVQLQLPWEGNNMWVGRIQPYSYKNKEVVSN